MTTLGLHGQVVVRHGTLSRDAELVVAPGDVVVLLGSSAAGKTTLLRALAGPLPPERGRVELDRVVLDDPAAVVLVPTEKRSIGMLFQDYLLLPHLLALGNVAFGNGVPRMAADDAALSERHLS